MVVAVAVLASLALIGWIVYRAVKVKSIKAHMVSYGLAIVAGVYTYAYLLSLDVPQLIKIVASILIGIILIIMAAMFQRRVSKRA